MTFKIGQRVITCSDYNILTASFHNKTGSVVEIGTDSHPIGVLLDEISDTVYTGYYYFYPEQLILVIDNKPLIEEMLSEDV